MWDRLILCYPESGRPMKKNAVRIDKVFRITAGIVLALLAAFAGMPTGVRALLFLFAAVMLFTGIFGF